MTPAGYRDMLINVIRRADAGDDEQLDGLAKYLSEIDRARQRLRDAGFGVIGTPITRQVDEVIAEQSRWSI